jgi:hypothetical protein
MGKQYVFHETRTYSVYGIEANFRHHVLIGPVYQQTVDRSWLFRLVILHYVISFINDITQFVHVAVENYGHFGMQI